MSKDIFNHKGAKHPHGLGQSAGASGGNDDSRASNQNISSAPFNERATQIAYGELPYGVSPTHNGVAPPATEDQISLQDFDELAAYSHALQEYAKHVNSFDTSSKKVIDLKLKLIRYAIIITAVVLMATAAHTTPLVYVCYGIFISAALLDIGRRLFRSEWGQKFYSDYKDNKLKLAVSIIDLFRASFKLVRYIIKYVKVALITYPVLILAFSAQVFNGIVKSISQILSFFKEIYPLIEQRLTTGMIEMENDALKDIAINCFFTCIFFGIDTTRTILKGVDFLTKTGLTETAQILGYVGLSIAFVRTSYQLLNYFYEIRSLSKAFDFFSTGSTNFFTNEVKPIAGSSLLYEQESLFTKGEYLNSKEKIKTLSDEIETKKNAAFLKKFKLDRRSEDDVNNVSLISFHYKNAFSGNRQLYALELDNETNNWTFTYNFKKSNVVDVPSPKIELSSDNIEHQAILHLLKRHENISSLKRSGDEFKQALKKAIRTIADGCYSSVCAQTVEAYQANNGELLNKSHFSNNNSSCFFKPSTALPKQAMPAATEDDFLLQPAY